MKIVEFPPRSQWPQILARPQMETRNLEQTVSEILEDVRINGDEAVKQYTTLFDKAEPDRLEVAPEEFEAAEAVVSPELKQAIETARQNIFRFHEAQKTEELVVETMPGVKCWQRSLPIEKVGLYVPGGTAPLFSTVLMLGVPAVIAGCKEIVLCSPPGADGRIHPAILYAAQAIGITRVFKVGGIQAIGAMAFGTETIPQVYKIFGPGNQFVTAAKQLVSRLGTAIDMPAGPSEVLVCADHSAVPAYVASDLLSQAEHGPDSQVVLVAFDKQLIENVQAELEVQLQTLPRQAIARQTLSHSVAILVKDKKEAIEVINAYAPEHLILALEDAAEVARQIA
ncbi:MAG: histidinol dehydrogenase, partial [Haliscomenobacter sp.]|nr:histidinol dehydrogenase [Haliscomenobacter sp.]